ncbi:MAG: hypothetical protein LC739_08745 [Actinobacteria bacterium]|nr:hypothetical protein [Actinomycetota bacterium]
MSRYVGEWLPEPIVTEPASDPATHAELSDSLSTAFLVLLETLTPAERAVLLLHDVFAYEYSEVAKVIGRSEANCRQLAVRARQRIEGRKPRFEASIERRWRLAEQFFAAVERRETDGLVKLLADEVTLYGDGGGKPLPFQNRCAAPLLSANIYPDRPTAPCRSYVLASGRGQWSARGGGSWGCGIDRWCCFGRCG